LTVDERIESGRAIEALRRKNLEGKRAFIEELRRHQDNRSISLLLEILCDESWYLRELAIKALVEMGEPARMPLRGILTSGLWYTRAAAVRALGAMGDAATAPHILIMLDDTNRTARDAAVTALKSLVAAGQTAALGRALAATAPERRGERLATLERIDPDLARNVEAAMAGAPAVAPYAADAPAGTPSLGLVPPVAGASDADATAPAPPEPAVPPAPPRSPMLSLFEIAAPAEPHGGDAAHDPPGTDSSHGEGGTPPRRP
jgi:hypothetical protein